MKRNILIFEKIVNGKAVRREVRCAESENDLHIKVQNAGGWNLVKKIG